MLLLQQSICSRYFSIKWAFNSSSSLSPIHTPTTPTSLSHSTLNKIHKWLHKNMLICMIKQNAVYSWIRVLLLCVSFILFIEIHSNISITMYSTAYEVKCLDASFVINAVKTCFPRILHKQIFHNCF